MLKKDLVCIVCPNGCQLDIEYEESPALKVIAVDGCTCEKGVEYAEQEIINPMRSISSSIRVDNGDFPLVSVRTDVPIPLGRIFDVMNAVKSEKVAAPVTIGDTLIRRPAGVDCNIIATRNINLCPSGK